MPYMHLCSASRQNSENQPKEIACLNPFQSVACLIMNGGAAMASLCNFSKDI